MGRVSGGRLLKRVYSQFVGIGTAQAFLEQVHRHSSDCLLAVNGKALRKLVTGELRPVILSCGGNGNRLA